ncbi:hypothetical protein [endosymbiont of Ridgeia piscesae]|jgi:hypothetical protein|uniref:Uncharacterized protein n=1 Tax=endosymbiont of Ridgeia piscesae TaxID=54398 RepID=A0A0T5YWZ9_9GAMM|nr:hypothetical protein [endosymbiont of Ridgeia piscesae]KRT55156.1 hypothetical protein Ga0074115_11452 [endosymbiont of Ridgeia piscesae]KRT59090.1 hypothetical protein Ga0076813_14872 [endosymbiont of Ridgeia piscesae]
MLTKRGDDGEWVGLAGAMRSRSLLTDLLLTLLSALAAGVFGSVVLMLLLLFVGGGI